MRWLDSNPVKLNNLIGSVFTILGSVAGFFVGRERGESPAYSLATGILAGMAVSVFYFVLYIVWLYCRPDGRHCQGTGRYYVASDAFTHCPICVGTGKERFSHGR